MTRDTASKWAERAHYQLYVNIIRLTPRKRAALLRLENEEKEWGKEFARGAFSKVISTRLGKGRCVAILLMSGLVAVPLMSLNPLLVAVLAAVLPLAGLLATAVIGLTGRSLPLLGWVAVVYQDSGVQNRHLYDMPAQRLCHTDYVSVCVSPAGTAWHQSVTPPRKLQEKLNRTAAEILRAESGETRETFLALVDEFEGTVAELVDTSRILSGAVRSEEELAGGVRR